MKVTVLNDKEKKDYSVVYSIIMLVLGIILLLNANQIITILFDILGAIVLLFGIYRFNCYLKMKNQFHTEDANALVSGVSSIAIGLLIILVSSILTNAISIVTGLWLFFIGVSKVNTALLFKEDRTLFIRNMTGALLFLLLGIYSIFAQNAVFMIIGIILILVSCYDLANYLNQKKK